MVCRRDHQALDTPCGGNAVKCFASRGIYSSPPPPFPPSPILPVLCVDHLSPRKCQKRYDKGKCYKTKIQKKCLQTCGTCTTDVNLHGVAEGG